MLTVPMMTMTVLQHLILREDCNSELKILIVKGLGYEGDICHLQLVNDDDDGNTPTLLHWPCG